MKFIAYHLSGVGYHGHKNTVANRLHMVVCCRQVEDHKEHALTAINQ